ncbi:hypothetical protein DL93DRAFT_2172576 [Clavulina sp. PMI_390]|nr:hypothetical protein DL93DRAFT_2172576 [Clavulina sp. PMI_390]
MSMPHQLEFMDPPEVQTPAHAESCKRQFPPEIWVIVLSFIPDRSDLKRCSLTNHLINHLTLPLIWTRFTLHLTRSYPSDISEHLSSIINHPKRAQYISVLRVLFLEPELETDTTMAPSNMGSPPLMGASMITHSTITSMIEAIFSLLDNVEYLSVIQLDRGTVETYYPHVFSIAAEGSDHEIYTGRQFGEPLAHIVLRTLENWLPKSKICTLSTVNVSFDALARLLKAPSSLSSLSMNPPPNDSLQLDNSHPPALPTLRSLRTSIRWARAFLSSTPPTHSLVLLGAAPYNDNLILINGIVKLPWSVKILEGENMSLYYLTKIARTIKLRGLGPNIQAIVHSSHVLENRESLEKTARIIRILYHSLDISQPTPTFVLRVTNCPDELRTGSDLAEAFAHDLANGRMGVFESRSSPPRIILELGALGTPDFACWIFTMESTDRWAFQSEINTIEDVAAREDLLYLTQP